MDYCAGLFRRWYHDRIPFRLNSLIACICKYVTDYYLFVHLLISILFYFTFGNYLSLTY
jgi:hypothetical protein